MSGTSAGHDDIPGEAPTCKRCTTSSLARAGRRTHLPANANPSSSRSFDHDQCSARQISPPAPARRRALSQRRRARDHADLSRGLRAADVRGLHPDRQRARPRGAARLLRSLCCDGGEARRRIHSGEPDLARQSRLGREARLRSRQARRRQPRRHRHAARDPRGAGDEQDAAGDQRRDRAARRRLRSRRCHERMGGGSLSCLADRRAEGCRRRSRHRLHLDQCQRGNWCRARGRGRVNPLRALLHARNRRQPSDRRSPRRGDSKRSTARPTPRRLIT